MKRFNLFTIVSVVLFALVLGIPQVLAQTFTGTITTGSYNDLVTVANNAGSLFNVVGLIALGIAIFFILLWVLKKIRGR